RSMPIDLSLPASWFGALYREKRCTEIILGRCLRKSGVRGPTNRSASLAPLRAEKSHPWPRRNPARAGFSVGKRGLAWYPQLLSREDGQTVLAAPTDPRRRRPALSSIHPERSHRETA